ncbi:MAG: hypothetical protein ACE5O2_15380, partial [Armatimonadota bacterium]
LRRRVYERIEENLKKVEEAARRLLIESKATARTRKAIETACRKYVFGRNIALRRRFHPEQQRFMRIIIAHRLVEYPHLHDELKRVVAGIRSNYGFEWASCPLTFPLQDEAKEIILNAAESEFGDTHLDTALAYVRYHHQMCKVQDITSYGELCTIATKLEAERVFLDRGAEYRAALGIQLVPRERLKGPQVQYSLRWQGRHREATEEEGRLKQDSAQAGTAEAAS